MMKTCYEAMTYEQLNLLKKNDVYHREKRLANKMNFGVEIVLHKWKLHV